MESGHTLPTVNHPSQSCIPAHHLCLPCSASTNHLPAKIWQRFGLRVKNSHKIPLGHYFFHPAKSRLLQQSLIKWLRASVSCRNKMEQQNFGYSKAVAKTCVKSFIGCTYTDFNWSYKTLNASSYSDGSDYLFTSYKLILKYFNSLQVLLSQRNLKMFSNIKNPLFWIIQTWLF